MNSYGDISFLGPYPEPNNTAQEFVQVASMHQSEWDLGTDRREDFGREPPIWFTGRDQFTRSELLYWAGDMQRELDLRNIKSKATADAIEHRKTTKRQWKAHKNNLAHKYLSRVALKEVQKAVRSGRLVRLGSCEICAASGQTVGHHWNGYNNPIDVWWICVKCNTRLRYMHDGSLETPAQAAAYIAEKFPEISPGGRP